MALEPGSERHRGRIRERERGGDCGHRARDLGQVVELHDRTRALIRPIRASDRERLNRGFQSASPDSIFLRFLSPKPRLTRGELEYLTAIDHVRHEALIAVDPETGQSFGTARFIRSREELASAEFAIGVGDRWMGIGLGTVLLCALVERARNLGVTRFTGTIRAENAAIKGLVQKVIGPFEADWLGEGAMQISVPLPAAPQRASTGSLRHFLFAEADGPGPGTQG